MIPPPIDTTKKRDDDGGMEARIQKLEQLAEKVSDRLISLDRDVSIIKSNYATKSDIAEAKTSIILWVVGAVIFAQLLPALPGIITSLKTLFAQ